MAGAFREFLLALAIGLMLVPASAQTGAKAEVWTAIIHDAFGGISYTWRLKADGTYEEDGVYIDTKASAQATLTGKWTRSRTRMVLTQDSLGFVFDGTVNGEQYYGTLFQYDQKVSTFCAWKGTEIPVGCDDGNIG